MADINQDYPEIAEEMTRTGDNSISATINGHPVGRIHRNSTKYRLLMDSTVEDRTNRTPEWWHGFMDV